MRCCESGGSAEREWNCEPEPVYHRYRNQGHGRAAHRLKQGGTTRTSRPRRTRGFFIERGERMIREAIAQLVLGQHLTAAEAEAVMNEIMSGEATPAQIGSFLTALRLKG